MIDENSPTWMRPISVERVRMRGLPVTAPTRGLSISGATRYAAAAGSSTASPSMQTRYSLRAARAPMRSAIALPWF
ncbi:hypothetical protein G6F40_017943 [Rhizopus arrhizus]|nr:hypothetical protein G6F40_017943 [Rhizopus arrhizus]